MYWIFSSGICTVFPGKQCLIAQQSLRPVIESRYCWLYPHKIPKKPINSPWKIPAATDQKIQKQPPPARLVGRKHRINAFPATGGARSRNGSSLTQGPEIRVRKRPKLWWIHWKHSLNGFLSRASFPACGPLLRWSPNFLEPPLQRPAIPL